MTAIGLLIGALSVTLMAQVRMQGRGMMNQAGQNAPRNTVTLVGAVTAASLAAGQGMPMITLRTSSGEVTVLVGPYRILMDNKFSISVNQNLQVEAFLDPRIPDTYKATRITDVGTGVSVSLATSGKSMRMGMGPRPGGAMRGMRNCVFSATDLDLKNKTILTGTVQSLNLNPGKNPPTIIVSTGSGAVAIAICPLQPVMRTTFQISVNDNVSIVAYPVTHATASYLAAEISNLTTQKSVKIRDENGLPTVMQGRGPGKCVCFN